MGNHKQHGFIHVGLMGLIIAVVIALGFVGWRILQNSNDNTPSLAAPTSPCEGRLYDSHAHPDDDAITQALPALMTDHAVGCTVLFSQMDLDNIDESLLEVREQYAGMPGRISIFYDVIGENPEDVTREKLDELYEKSDGRFSGLGEFAFYEEVLHDVPVTSPNWEIMFEFAGEKNLPIMIHPQRQIIPDLETMLTRYPNTKVIVHGFELPDIMGDLLKKHANLYFTLDTATLLVYDSEEPGIPVQPLMYPGDSKERTFDASPFIAAYDKQRSGIIAEAVETWLPVLLAAPDKVLWGTDISLEDHVDKAVYERLMDITNAFLAEAPKEHHANYLRNNALQLLGEGQTLEQPTDEELEEL